MFCIFSNTLPEKNKNKKKCACISANTSPDSTEGAGARSRSVYLPRGRWLDKARRAHDGPTWLIDHPVDLGEVAVFEVL